MMSSDKPTDDKCIFCRIGANKDPKTTILHENDEFAIFRDIRPASRDHYLVIPKHHISNPKILKADDIDFVERLISFGKEYLISNGGDINASRLGFHWPPFTSVSHLHLHVISPVNEMSWLASAIFKPKTFWFVTTDWLLDHLKSKV